MTIRYLLDTNVLSEPIKPNPNSHVLAKLDLLSDYCAMASTTYHEISYGIMRLPKSRRRALLETYLESLRLPVLAYDLQAANLHARVRANMADSGRIVPFADGQIASIALANSLTLVTRNVADFENYPSLSLENWFNPADF